MKRIFLTIICSVIALLVFSQHSSVKEKKKDAKQYYKNNYSNFYGTVYGAFPVFMDGDFTYLINDKVDFGLGGGIKFGYQFTPLIGVSLDAKFGKNKLKSNSSSDYMVSITNGQILDATGSLSPENAIYIKDLCANITQKITGVHIDVNVAAAVDGDRSRKYAIVLSPAVYVHQYSSDLRNLTDGVSLLKDKVSSPVSFGFGCDLDIRLKATRSIDLLITGGTAYLANPSFGDDKPPYFDKRISKYTHIAHVGVGLVFNFGSNDNLIYAPKNMHLKRMLNDSESARLQAERIVSVNSKAKYYAELHEKSVRDKDGVVSLTPKEKVSGKSSSFIMNSTLPELPIIHFSRGSARIDIDKHSSELKTIVDLLTEKNDIAVEISGYCDHTGSDAHNEILSRRRTESLKKYLLDNGIPETKLETKGLGKDPRFTGQDILSVKPKRAS